jgi:hypothetical protein
MPYEPAVHPGLPFESRIASLGLETNFPFVIKLRRGTEGFKDL